MTEKDKMLSGMIYDANNDPALIAERLECKELCRDYNELRPRETEAREILLRKPCLGAERLFRSSGYFIRIAVCLVKCVQTAMPIIVTLIITIENELITLVIDLALAGTGVGAILLLVLGIQLGVKHRYFNFMFHCHCLFMGLLLILFFTLSHAGLPDRQH